MNKLHGKQSLHSARLGKIADRDATTHKNDMSISRLAHLRVARFFIKKMRPFSECEDPTFREQDAREWEACGRDTMCATIGECFLVPAEQVKLVMRSVLKRAVLGVVHLNADLWTSKVSYQKFLGVRIMWKSGPDMKTALLVVTLHCL